LVKAILFYKKAFLKKFSTLDHIISVLISDFNIFEDKSKDRGRTEVLPLRGDYLFSLGKIDPRREYSSDGTRKIVPLLRGSIFPPNATRHVLL